MSQVRGDTPFLGLLDFLQIAGFNHRDLTLSLSGASEAGHLVMHDGDLVDASSQKGTRGVSALFPLLQDSAAGTFELLPPPSEPPRTTLTLKIGQILMRAAMAMPAQDAPSTTSPEWRIEGDTAMLSVEELLQIFESSKRPAAALFQDAEGRTVELTLAEGGVLEARCGTLTGVDAVYALLGTPDWTFRMAPPASAPRVEKILDIPSLVMEGLRRRDEQQLVQHEISAEHNDHARETLERLDAGELDETARMQLAKRYLPGGEVAPAFLVARLTVDESPAVRAAAMESLHDLPVPIIVAFANDPDTAPPLLTYLLLEYDRKGNLREVPAAAVTNPSTPLPALVEYAPVATGAALEAYEQRSGLLQQNARLRSALRSNPACPFVELLDRLDKEAGPRMRKRKFTEVLKRVGDDEDELVLTKPTIDPRKQKPPTRIGPRDIQYLAKRGTLRQKMDLVCGNDDDVAVEIISQPGIPESFVLGVAEMKASNSAALRWIAGNRTFRRNANIIHALLFNPKTPVPSSSGLLTLVRADVTMKIAGSRDLPDGLRQSARQLMDKRKRAKSKKGH